MLTAILDERWTVERIDRWFNQRRASASVSKYAKVDVKEEDMSLWKKYCAICPPSDELNLPSLIAQSKARAATYLASNYSFWQECNYEIDGWPVLQSLQSLQTAYDQRSADNDEEAQLSHLFGCDIDKLPVLEQLAEQKVTSNQGTN